MKIFMLIRYLNYSGAPKMFLWVAQQLQTAGHDVAIYTFSNNVPDNIPQNLKVIKEDLSSLSLLGKVRHIRKQIKIANADISISFLLDANVFNTLACMGLNTKSIICERSDPFKPGYYKLKILKPIFRFADGAVFQLPKVSEFYDNIKGHVETIPNPVLCKNNIDLPIWDERKNIIVTIGRLDQEQKRHDLLIRSFAKFFKSHPDYKLAIYGSGPDTELMKSISARLDIGENVLFPGVTDTPQETMKNCKFFVLSSDFEGIPNALIEAMSIGMPVISTDCSPGGAALLINNKENGLLVPRGDVDKLYEAMEYMVSHPDEADQMGTNAKKIVNTFSEELISSKWNEYVNLYKSR